MNQNWRLQEHNLALGETYILDVPVEWLHLDIGAEDWSGKEVIVEGTNSQFACWIEVSMKDGLEEGIFAAEPEWLRPINKLCNCDITILMCRGCQCGGK